MEVIVITANKRPCHRKPRNINRKAKRKQAMILVYGHRLEVTEDGYYKCTIKKCDYQGTIKGSKDKKCTSGWQ